MDPVVRLRSRILLVLAALPLAACEREEGQACITLDEVSDTCPSVTEAEGRLVGDESCGERILSVNGPGQAIEDTAGAVEECCYPVTKVDQSPGMECMEGRPLRGERGAVVAAAARTDAWAHGPAPIVDALSDAQRAALADAWTSAALAEHASVAAFAKVTLELLAFGAPADLVAATQAAAADEVRHARRAFMLAADYAGAPVGPGRLPVGDLALCEDLAAFAVATVREGCVGETIAALLATEALAGATDPAVRAVLEGVVRDETRHAALAWSTVRWAIGAGGAPVRAAVAEAFAQALSGGTVVLPEGLVEGGAAHGRLDAARAMRVIARGLAEVLTPCAAALLGEGVRAPEGARA